jgi:hypothetical protein
VVKILLVLLGCDTVWTRSWIPVFQRNILSPSSELKSEMVCFSETLVSTYESTQHHNKDLTLLVP